MNDPTPGPSVEDARLVFYNEHDLHAAAWLRNLAREELIPDGTIDEADIQSLSVDAVRPHRIAHFFAGIGGWPLALDLAGWPRDRPVWTGSCPCQPFSAAGRGLGTADDRHLWPAFRNLIAECRPPVVFGEQVASRLGREWLAGVRSDLEALGYAVGAADLCAAGVGAPHIRQRLYWVANSISERVRGERRGEAGATTGRVQSPDGEWERIRLHAWSGGSGLAGRMANAKCPSWGQMPERGESVSDGQDIGRAQAAGESGIYGEVVFCRDGKCRRIEPGTFPLAHGVSGRVGLLRGYGNAIVPQVAATFIRAFLDTEQAA